MDRDVIPALVLRVLHGIVRHTNSTVVRGPLSCQRGNKGIQCGHIRVRNHGQCGHGLPSALALGGNAVPVGDAQVLHSRFSHAYNGMTVFVGVVEEDG